MIYVHCSVLFLSLILYGSSTKAIHRSLDKEYNVFTLIFGLRQNTLKVCK